MLAAPMKCLSQTRLNGKRVTANVVGEAGRERVQAINQVPTAFRASLLATGVVTTAGDGVVAVLRLKSFFPVRSWIRAMLAMMMVRKKSGSKASRSTPSLKGVLGSKVGMTQPPIQKWKLIFWNAPIAAATMVAIQ